MNDIEKRNIAFALLLGFLVIFSVLFFIFQNFLNKGTLIITENSKTFAPFSLYEIKGGYQVCESLPCELKVFAGNKYLIFQKQGYKDKTLNYKVSFLKKHLIELDMEIEPYLEFTDLKINQNFNPYGLIIDQKTGIQKLVNLLSSTDNDIAFFPKFIEDPRYFLSADNLLILDKNSSPILVNILTGEKSYIENIFENAENIVFSRDAKFFAFENTISSTIQIYNKDNSEIIDTNIKANGDTLFAFADDKSLFLITTDEEAEYFLVVKKFFPPFQFEEIIYKSNEITEKAEQVFITANASEIFIETKNKVVKIVLKIF